MTRNLALVAITGSALLGAVSTVQAASTWDFSASGCQPTGNAAFGNTVSCAASSGTANSVTVSAWGAATTASGLVGFQAAYLSPQGSGSGYGTASQLETLNVSQPDHSMDNNPAGTTPDMIVLKFTNAVALDKITLGWSQSDADFTVMAYTGTATTAAGIVQGKTAANLTAGAGWALVENSGDADALNPQGNYTTATGGSGTDIERQVNKAKPVVTSSWWLISAYNSGYGGGSLDALVDYMKLLGVASKDVTPPPNVGVPEPGSLALAGLALFGLFYTRRQAQQRNNS